MHTGHDICVDPVVAQSHHAAFTSRVGSSCEMLTSSVKHMKTGRSSSSKDKTLTFSKRRLTQTPVTVITIQRVHGSGMYVSGGSETDAC